MAAHAEVSAQNRAADRDVLYAQALRGFPALVQALGGSSEGLIRAASGDEAPRRGLPLRFSHFVLLLDLSAEHLGAPDFGLRLAARQKGFQGVSPLGVAMRYAPTIGHALDYYAAHTQAYSPSAHLHFLKQPRDGSALLALGLEVDPALDPRQAIEHALLLAANNLALLGAGRVAARKVSLSHAPLSRPDVYEKGFACPVHFNQGRNGLWLSAEDLATPIVGADPMMFDMATGYIEAHFPTHPSSFAREVRGMILHRLSSGGCTLDELAKDFGFSSRAFQRRLYAEGTSLAALKDEIRRELAEHLVARTPLTLGDMAERLGYAEASVLARSLKRWFGGALHSLRRSDHNGLQP